MIQNWFVGTIEFWFIIVYQIFLNLYKYSLLSITFYTKNLKMYKTYYINYNNKNNYYKNNNTKYTCLSTAPVHTLYRFFFRFVN